MRKIFPTLIGAVGLIAIAISANAEHGEAPIEGIMQNFIELDEPVAAPPTPVVSKDEGPITLDRFQGKFVVLNFWATWCGPCIRELPSLHRLNAKFTGGDFAVVLPPDTGVVHLELAADALAIDNTAWLLPEPVRTVQVCDLLTDETRKRLELDRVFAALTGHALDADPLVAQLVLAEQPGHPLAGSTLLGVRK